MVLNSTTREFYVYVERETLSQLLNILTMGVQGMQLILSILQKIFLTVNFMLVSQTKSGLQMLLNLSGLSALAVIG